MNFSLNNFLGALEISDRVHAAAETHIGSTLFSAVVPMVKVVATVITTSFLPLKEAFSLMLYSDTLLELGVVVSTAVPSVHRDEKRV